MNLSDMIAHRRMLVRKLNELEEMRRPIQSELEALERDLFSRVSAVVEALEGVPRRTAAPMRAQRTSWALPASLKADLQAKGMLGKDQPPTASAPEGAIQARMADIAKHASALMAPHSTPTTITAGPDPVLMAALMRDVSVQSNEITDVIRKSVRESMERRTEGESRARLMPHIIETLREAARPVTRNELFDMLVAKGIAVPGKDPRANLSAHLSYSDAIVRDTEGRWMLRQQELQNNNQK